MKARAFFWGRAAFVRPALALAVLFCGLAVFDSGAVAASQDGAGPASAYVTGAGDAAARDLSLLRAAYPEAALRLERDGGFLYLESDGKRALYGPLAGCPATVFDDAGDPPVCAMLAQRYPAGPGAPEVRRAKEGYPQAVVDAFEAEGFIWGGKWHSFDFMHFEYRPELLLNR